MLELLGGVGFEAKLDGSLRAHCENIHTSRGCPEDLEFNHKNKTLAFTGVAEFDGEDIQNDALSAYSNFGVTLDRFSYIPTLLFDIFIKG